MEGEGTEEGGEVYRPFWMSQVRVYPFIRSVSIVIYVTGTHLQSLVSSGTNVYLGSRTGYGIGGILG